MTHSATQTEDVKYFYVFHGNIPDIMMARVAYRRVGWRDLPELSRERKVINCPFCREHLTDVDKETKVELIARKGG